MEGLRFRAWVFSFFYQVYIVGDRGLGFGLATLSRGERGLVKIYIRSRIAG